MDMIKKVISGKGTKMLITDVRKELLKLYEGDPYCEQKASGSIGGAVASGYISYCGDYFICNR